MNCGQANAEAWGRIKRREQQASLYRLWKAWFSKPYVTYEQTPRKPVSLLPRSTGSAPPPRQRLVVLIERIFYTRAGDLQGRGDAEFGVGGGMKGSFGFSFTSSSPPTATLADAAAIIRRRTRASQFDSPAPLC